MHRRKKPPTKSSPPTSFPAPKPPAEPTTLPKPSGTVPTFLLLSLIRLTSALTHPITDCDETFNYWEPLHYLLFNHGFQTWEYSPTFALRSYAYLIPSHILSRTSLIFTNSKIPAFYTIRLTNALLSAAAETSLCTAVAIQFGSNVARLLFIFLVFSPGIFRTAVEFLPSSFAMISLTMAFADWMRNRRARAVFFVALASLLGWIYAAALAIPLALDILLRKNGIGLFVKYALQSGVPILLIMTMIDSYYFGKLVIAPLNHILYNVFPKQGAGSHLFGVEDVMFYIFNLFLNTNVTILLFAVFPFLCIVRFCFPSSSTFNWRHLRFLLPTYLWLAIFMNQPHKEERFLAPCYTFIPLVAAASFTMALDFLVLPFTSSSQLPSAASSRAPHNSSSTSISFPNIARGIKLALLLIVILTYAAFSVSRIMMQVTAFSAPLALYKHLSEHELQKGLGPRMAPIEYASPDRQVNICIGKEWYRFPTSFFLPNRRFRARFIQSGFDGLLPKPFQEDAFGTRVIPDGMNEFNKADPAQFYDWQQEEGCHYFVDLDLSHRQDADAVKYAHPVPEEFRQVVFRRPFLDSEASRQGFRAFYVPGFKHHLVYGEYQLVRNLKLLPYS